MQTVFQKDVQSGISTYFILTALYTAAELGLWTFYVLPTQPLRDRFVQMRVDTAISGSEHYRKKQQEAVGRMDGVAAKFFGKGAIAFVGSNSANEFIEIPADQVIIDERDQCSEEHLSKATDRYHASKWKMFMMGGNLTVPDFGISAAYNESNQMHWLIPCPHCGHRQELDWYQHVIVQVDESKFELLDSNWKSTDPGDPKLPCMKCNKPLDRLARGEWVPSYQDNPINGYQISHLFDVNTTVREMAFHQQNGFFPALADMGKLQTFHNSQLGIPFLPPGSGLSPDVLKDNVHDMPREALGIRPFATLGADIGKLIHVVIRGHMLVNGAAVHPLIKALTVPEFSDLDRLMKEFNIQMAVVDANPETREAKAFQARHKGKVWLCEYYANPSITDLKLDRIKGRILCDRTQSLDGMAANFINKVNWLPIGWHMIDGGDYSKHLQAPKRVYNENTKRFYWYEGRKADHYFHSENYCARAYDLLQRGVGACLALSDYSPRRISPTEKTPEQLRYAGVMDWLFPETVTDETRKLVRDYELSGGVLVPKTRKDPSPFSD
jgi:hypothetical protein